MVQKYLYIRLAINSALGHFQLPLTLFDKAATLLILLKVFDVSVKWFAGVIVCGGILFLIYAGHMMIKHKIVEREMTLSQKYNAEFQEILEFVRENKKKKRRKALP